MVVLGPSESHFSFHALSNIGAGVPLGLTDSGPRAPGGCCIAISDCLLSLLMVFAMAEVVASMLDPFLA